MDSSSSRQRMLDTFNYNHPDKLPVVYHPSPAGLYVHGQKLLDLFNRYPSDNPICYDHLPTLGAEAFDVNGDYHQILTDNWGTGWEYRIFGIAGHPKYYPFASWKEALANYQFPPFTVVGSSQFAQEKQANDQLRERYLIFNGWFSIFEKLHALQPFDRMLVDLAMEDRDLLAFLDRLVEYWLGMIDYYAALGTDIFVFGDDWGTQTSTLISPEMFRQIFCPRYQKLFDRVHQQGGWCFLHCCGQMGPLLDEFLELGIRGLWPQLNLYGEDPQFIEKCRVHRVAVYLHPDRQRLIPLGTPEEIRTYVRHLADRYHRLGGGAIFYVEIENDAPFENVEALIESIHEYR